MPASMTDHLRKYAELAGFGERLRWIVVIAFGLVVSALEALGAFLIYLLLGLVAGPSEPLDVPFVRQLGGIAPIRGDSTLLLFLVALVGGFFIVRAFAVLGKEYVEARVVQNAGARLSGRLVRTYLNMPYSFHLQRNSAELIRNAYTTVQELVGSVFRPLVRIVSESLVVVGILVVLIATAPIATVFVVLMLGPVTWFLLRMVHHRLGRLGRDMQETLKDSLRSLQQSLHGIRDIKVLGREAFFEREYRRARKELARVNYRQAVLSDVPSVGVETLLVVFIAAFFALVILVEGTPEGAIPILGLFAYAALRLKPSLNVISKGVSSLRYSSAGIDDVYNDLTSLEQDSAGVESSDLMPLPFENEISVVGVSLQYENADTYALHDIDLRIRKGESVGIVGRTGGGKTTLVDVILGLLPPTMGAVLVDGQDIKGHIAAWQRNIGMVPQTLFLVDDTIRRNIALGVHDEEIDDDLVREAIDLAQLTPMVDMLPQGLDTPIGERGVRLSGGQRQRIAIARALYRRPSVLIFDEATSALDHDTETRLLTALEGLRGAYTLLTVAHRLTTVKGCDRVVWIEGGRVVGVGSYEDVVEGSGFRDSSVSRGGRQEV